jgi:hypothetical protein
MRFIRFGFPLGLFVSAIALIGMRVSALPGVQLQTFANSFLGTLDDDQRSTAVMEYASPKRVDWHFIPKKTRKGLVMREMNAAQRTAALRLVRAALSEIGYDKASRIMLLEGVLNKLEGDRGNWERDPEKYYLTIFGTPSETGVWGLSFEGHHLSLNFSCRGGEVVDSTPQFFASNPATVMDDVPGPIKKGTRVLRDEEQMGFDLVNSLNEDQQEQAILSDKALKEIRFAGEAQATVAAPEGIPLSELDEKQQKQLKTLVMVYTNAVAEKVAERRRDQIEKNGWDNVHFAWAGAKKPGIGHYYRIRGSEFLIEFVNTQADAAGNPANHIHCVWRDITGDFDLPAK